MLKITLFLTMLLVSVQSFAATPVESTLTEPTLAGAEALLKQGREADAITQLRQLVEYKPEYYQAWFLLGVTEAGQRRFHDAIASFRQVISLQPKLAEPHNNLAVIYNELGDFRAAVQELEASLQLKPDYVTAQENIGDLYVKLAANAYRQALAKADNTALRQRYKRLLRIRYDDSVQPETVNETAVNIPNEPAEAAGQQSVGTELVIADETNQSATEQDTGNIETPAAKLVNKPETAEQLPPVSMETEPKQIAVSTQTLIATQTVVATAPLSITQQDVTEEVLLAVEAWRAAWSRRDMNAYFAAYGDAFEFGERYQSMQKWKDYKTWAISKRSFIQVGIENITLTDMADGVIKVVFLQHFRSDSFNSDDIKEMMLSKKADGWKIIHEISR